MRMAIRDQGSGWLKVTSGVPQRSVLAQIMFLICLKYMVEGIDGYISSFADDAKVVE